MIPPGIQHLPFCGFISSLFMAPGGAGERKEIGIFLIKMQLYTHFFHLRLHKLNITFLRLNCKVGCRLAGRAKGRLGNGRDFRLQGKEWQKNSRSQIQTEQASQPHCHQPLRAGWFSLDCTFQRPKCRHFVCNLNIHRQGLYPPTTQRPKETSLTASTGVLSGYPPSPREQLLGDPFHLLGKRKNLLEDTKAGCYRKPAVSHGRSLPHTYPPVL